jgi:hypothetical protein
VDVRNPVEFKLLEMDENCCPSESVADGRPPGAIERGRLARPTSHFNISVPRRQYDEEPNIDRPTAGYQVSEAAKEAAAAKGCTAESCAIAETLEENVVKRRIGLRNSPGLTDAPTDAF